MIHNLEHTPFFTCLLLCEKQSSSDPRHVEPKWSTLSRSGTDTGHMSSLLSNHGSWQRLTPNCVCSPVLCLSMYVDRSMATNHCFHLVWSSKIMQHLQWILPSCRSLSTANKVDTRRSSRGKGERPHFRSFEN